MQKKYVEFVKCDTGEIVDNFEKLVNAIVVEIMIVGYNFINRFYTLFMQTYRPVINYTC